MPALAQHFRVACDDASRLAVAGEQIRVKGDSQIRSEMTVSRLEYLYEIAFLRMFLAWETFLEESFVRYMCGCCGLVGQPQTAVSGAYSPSISHARAVLHGNQHYLLWHSPAKVAARSKMTFVNGLHEVVLASNQSRIDCFASVRHRIAHAQLDARNKFDSATMNLAGRRYPASRVGRFLRDSDPSQPLPTRWIDAIANELVALAQQVAPP